MIQKELVVILLLVVHGAFSQRSNNSRPDTLANKSFDYVHNQFGNTINNPAKSKIYAFAMLQKAKVDQGNFNHLALAYKACIVNADKFSRMVYVDSMVNSAIKTNNIELIGASYLTKGIIFYGQMQHMKALDNYLIADHYISQLNNPVLNYKVKYEIAKIKYYLGFYDEAISLLRECVAFYHEENDRAYLNSLHMLGLSYTRIQKYQLATQTNKLGIEQGRAFEDTGMEFYFEHSAGINQCLKGDYTNAIKTLDSVLPKIISVKDFANEATAYYYIGESNWSLKRFDKAATYFKKVDQIFNKEKYILPDLRKGYEYLIGYYKGKNTELQLYYIDQLLKVDKMLAQDYKYLLKKIVKEYDTKELIQAKKAIENTVVFTRFIAGAIILIMAFVIICLIHRNRRNRKLFEELMNRDTSNHPLPSEADMEHLHEDEIEIPVENATTKPQPRTISPEIEAAIVRKLEKFECNKKFLEKDMTVTRMAVILQTNPKYVTKIIAKHRGKGTIDYITHLKLNFIIEMLKTESRYRNYTHKALGEEAGFRTTQNFTRAFKAHTGITPTYFIYKLKKSATTDSSN